MPYKKKDYFPKKVLLKDGKEVILKPLQKTDLKNLIEYFKKLKDSDRVILRDNVLDKKILKSWTDNIDYEKNFPIIAEYNKKIVAVGSLHRSEKQGYSHLGFIRITVASNMQKKGLGSLIAKELYVFAIKRKIEKIIAEVPADKKGAANVFKKLGFYQEAVLKKHLKDLKGRKHDIIIMSNNINYLWDLINDHTQEFEYTRE